MALITCKECKHQVSDSAGRCPSCGAKVRKPLSAIHWIGIVFLGVPCLFSIFAMLWTGPTGPDGSGSAPAASAYKFQLSSKEKHVLDWIISDDERAFIDGTKNALFDARIQRVTAKEIARKYADNEVAADQEFKGKTVLLEGIVQDIQSGIGDEPFLVFNGVNMFLGPQAKFKTPDIQRIANIRKGEKQRLVCVAAGEAIGNPFFDDCVFLETHAMELKKSILSDVDQYLQSGAYTDESIPKVVAGALVIAAAMPDDSPCLTDTSKCEAAIGSGKSKNELEAIRAKVIELMKSKGLSVPSSESKGKT